MRKLLSFPFVLLILLYRWLLSWWLPRTCRYNPTCSHYALEALRAHPLYRALWLILNRLSRCHPWGGWGDDPVPPSR